MAARSCPQCSAPNAPDAPFCEACGYDFTSAGLPQPPAGDEPEDESPWVAELSVDPAWYEVQESPDPLPAPGPPMVRPLRGRSVLVGRTSQSRNLRPDVDCESDSGVSRRQSQLSTDGSRWWVEDLESANGTFVGPADGPLPTDPIPVGVRHELAPDDRIYIGAWTRLVVRPATEEERDRLR
jgi:hypothetical protein